MQDNGLPGLNLDFLYYETPAGKVKRNRQFGREHIDILAGDRKNSSLVVVEVKKKALISVQRFRRDFPISDGYGKIRSISNQE